MILKFSSMFVGFSICRFSGAKDRIPAQERIVYGNELSNPAYQKRDLADGGVPSPGEHVIGRLYRV